MSKVKMQEARELIRAGRYNEARDILMTIDHPIAEEWLDKLDKIAPDKRQTNVYATVHKDDAHPYATTGFDTSEWMRVTSQEQANLAQRQQQARKRAEQAERRERLRQWSRIPAEILCVSIFAVIAALLYDFMVALSLDAFRGGRIAIGFGLIIGLPLKLLIRDRGSVRHVLMVTIATYASVVLGKYFQFLDAINVPSQLAYLIPYWDDFMEHFFDYVTGIDVLFATFGIVGAVMVLAVENREIK
jgi:hypothetical protein